MNQDTSLFREEKEVTGNLKKKGCPTVTIPNDAELAKGTEHSLLKVLEKVKNGG